MEKRIEVKNDNKRDKVKVVGGLCLVNQWRSGRRRKGVDVGRESRRLSPPPSQGGVGQELSLPFSTPRSDVVGYSRSYRTTKV